MTDTDDARALNTLTYPREAIVQMRKRAEQAEAQAAALREWVRGFVDVADHTRVFLSSREKMHPHGLDLWDLAVHEARSLIDKEAADAE